MEFGLKELISGFFHIIYHDELCIYFVISFRNFLF